MRLPPQSCTTRDEQSIVAGVVVRYKIVDVKPYVCDLQDQADALIDVLAGAVVKHVRKATAEELFNRPPETAIRAELRDHVKQYGFEIEAVTFKDLTRGKTLRLAAAELKDLAN
jgi:regulator of protease activity HflC (stomatin/prohibitin superfamily)